MTYGKLIIVIIALAAYLPWTFFAVKDWLSFFRQKINSKNTRTPRVTMTEWLDETTKWWNLFHLMLIVVTIVRAVVYYWNTPI